MRWTVGLVPATYWSSLLMNPDISHESIICTDSCTNRGEDLHHTIYIQWQRLTNRGSRLILDQSQSHSSCRGFLDVPSCRRTSTHFHTIIHWPPVNWSICLQAHWVHLCCLDISSSASYHLSGHQHLCNHHNTTKSNNYFISWVMYKSLVITFSY